MKSHAAFLLIATLFVALAAAQQSAQTGSGTVPQLIPYSGIAKDVSGKALSGVVGITFLLYQQEQGGSPLWLETQNVQADSRGHYSVQLGATLPNGVPNDIFVSGEARWLGIQIAGQSEAARVMLLSVPYAMKAGDAQTLGGLPASAFILAAPMSGGASGSALVNTATFSTAAPATTTSNVTTTGGTVNAIPLFTTATNIQNSAITQTGTGTTAKVGIGTTTPSTTFDVKGSATIRGAASVMGTLTLPATSPATATKGTNSQPEGFAASSFNSTIATAVAQTFQWQAEPVGNDTAAPSASLNLLFGQGNTKPSETGLHIANNGLISFASGQTFPGTGTITGITAGSGLTGGGTSGAVTLNLDATKVPLLTTGNTFAGNQTVNGNLSATGLVTGSAFNIGSNLFDSGSYANQNALLGFAGNTTMTGADNTAAGYQALANNTGGSNNTATGVVALFHNTSGGSNTAHGYQSLYYNTTGSNNVAVGYTAGNSTNAASTTGSNNTFVGSNANPGTQTSLSNATAIGANAQVTASNAMVLGSINGVNGATAGTNVGIGTTAPAATLDVHGTGSFTGLVNFAGFVNFASGQTFPGTGTVTSVSAGFGLKGGPITNSGTLTLDTTLVPQLSAANTFSANQAVNGTVTATAFAGNGAGVSNVNASQLGGLGPSAFVQLAANNTFTGNQTVNVNLSATGLVTGGPATFATSNSSAVPGTFTNSAAGGIILTTTGSEGYPLVLIGDTSPIINVNTPNSTTGVGVDGIDTFGGGSFVSNGGPAIYATGGNYGGGSVGLGGPGGIFSGGFGYDLTSQAELDGDGIDATNYDGGTASTGGYAGNFAGDINVSGHVFAGSKDFKIDHPLDPANQYLFHASVESSEMKNIYDGMVTLDSGGAAVVELPAWFEAVNGDFRYQLTAIGKPGPGLYVAQEISGNHFAIAGGAPSAKVSWQVTGVRHDAYATANPLIVEQAKPERERGSYIHPELYGAPAERGVEWARNPGWMQHIKQHRPERLRATDPRR